MTDFEEVTMIGTDPANPDTDGDGVIDGLDSNPLEPRWLIYVIFLFISLGVIGTILVLFIIKNEKI